MDPYSLQRIGRFPVLRFIAEGGFAWVFEVIDPRFDARRALKMLKPAAAEGDEFLRFQSEVMLLAQLDHPNLITVFEFGQDEETGCHYYVMSLIEGPNLQQMIHERGPIPADQAGPIFLDALAGLSALHDANIIHRDIKPSNILVTRDGLGKLGDLGIARVRGQSGRTKTNTALGTELYMSPEQARAQTVGPQSDVFSLGLTLYQVLTGHTVYEAAGVDTTSGYDVLMYLGSLIHGRGEKPKKLDFHFPNEIPRPIRGVIEKACDIDPNGRYADAREMYEALNEALMGGGETTGRSVAFVASAAAVLLLLAVGGWFAYRWLTREDPQAALTAAAAVEAKAREAIEATGRLESAPAELLGSLREELEGALTMKETAQGEIAGGNGDLALGLIRRAKDRYEGVCKRLLHEHLSARATAEVQTATQRAAADEAAGGAKQSPGPWAQIQAELPQLAAAARADAPACEAAAQEADRTKRAGAVIASVRSIERTMEDQWPELASKARESALAAQKRAAAATTDAPEYRDALAAGSAKLQAGDAARGESKHLPARDAYALAQQAFEEAAAIVPAARARSEAAKLPQDNASLAPTLASANEAFAAHRYGDAEAEFRKAVDRWRNMKEESEASKRVDAAASAADLAREAARKDGAVVSAVDEFAKGETLRSQAQAAIDEKHPDTAIQRYGEAKAAYAAAQQAARKEVARAREQGQKARKDVQGLVRGKDCTTTLRDAGAQGSCADAVATLERADEALRAADAPAALSGFSKASQQVAAALELEKGAGPPPAPPKITRVTRDRTISIGRGRDATATVKATDPNGDPVTLTWTFEGETLPSREATVAFRPGKNGTLTVRADDGKDGSDSASWSVVILNQKPDLKVTPGDVGELQPGRKVTFEARASDPDGEGEVTPRFLLDGREVGEGSAWTFTAGEGGDHRLEVRATDAEGATTVVARTLRVVRDEVPTTEKSTTASIPSTTASIPSTTASIPPTTASIPSTTTTTTARTTPRRRHPRRPTPSWRSASTRPRSRPETWSRYGGCGAFRPTSCRAS